MFCIPLLRWCFALFWHHQCVQEMGNAKAKRLYEAFLPECFQRPETDQSAEIFIRDKYDKKKYMDKVIDIQMLRVSLHIRSGGNALCLCLRKDQQTGHFIEQGHSTLSIPDGTIMFSLNRKRRAVTIYPRSQLCLRRWNWWVHLSSVLLIISEVTLSSYCSRWVCIFLQWRNKSGCQWGKGDSRYTL